VLEPGPLAVLADTLRQPDDHRLVRLGPFVPDLPAQRPAFDRSGEPEMMIGEDDGDRRRGGLA